ncbi:unnamed protein product [Lampetra planeri]
MHKHTALVFSSQIRVDMRTERTTGDTACESTGALSLRLRSTMECEMCEIQTLVEQSDIINRPHLDSDWLLQSSPGELDVQLVRTVQKVLACRYQAAQLDVEVMVKQLEEAEDLQRCVRDQVSGLKSRTSAWSLEPSVLKSLEEQWSSSLLDASATVQVKAAQLDQVRRYHRQMRMLRVFLQVVAAEREKSSVDAESSSAGRAEKLHGLLQTVEQKKDVLRQLLALSRQLAVHLSDAESSGALLAQLGDVQDEWRLLAGSLRRSQRHAANSASQSSVLMKEINHLKDQIHRVDESHDARSTLALVCQETELKLCHQRHLHLRSQSDALVRFSPAQEDEERERNLQEVESLLSHVDSKLDWSSRAAGVSSAKAYKLLEDLVMWVKQGERHSEGKKLSLFPEEARIQIEEMRRFQTDVLSRRSKFQMLLSEAEEDDRELVLKTVEDVCEGMDDVLDTMEKNLQQREKLLCELANMDAWLAETHAQRDACAHVDNISGADLHRLQIELKTSTAAASQTERQLHLLEEMEERSRELAEGLSPGESRYLVNRLSGLWSQLDGLLAHQRATGWELEEVIHEQTSSAEELATIQDNLQQIATDLQQQRFPVTQETSPTLARLQHLLMEHQWQVQEIQHCQEARRSSLLCTIGELQDRCKALSVHTFEQGKYLRLKNHMLESRDMVKEQIQRAKDKSLSVGERFRLCQVLLVELPLVKTQCQEAADQLETLAQELVPSQLQSERQSIRCGVEDLVSWEHSVTDDIKHLEAQLLPGLRLTSELPAFMQLFKRVRAELQDAEPVSPDERAIDSQLQRCWVVWRNVESGMRLLEALGRREKMNLKDSSDVHSLRGRRRERVSSTDGEQTNSRHTYLNLPHPAVLFDFVLQQESLSRARESLKDYHEEQQQTQQAVEALEQGLQAHICHLVELVPQQLCLSRPETEQLHISILSQLLVGRAVLEAQAQLRMESLHRLVSPVVDVFVQVLLEDLCGVAGRMDELRAGCPTYGCGVGKDGELGALWRRWAALRRGVGLLMARTEQKGEEWRDIATSMEQCCSLLVSLQSEGPDSSSESICQEPRELLAQAEVHQVGLEQEQEVLASLEHRLEHVMSLSGSKDPISSGSVGKTLVKLQENIRSLKERNVQVLAAAQEEEERRRAEELEELERDTVKVVSSLETYWNSSTQQMVKSRDPMRNLAGQVMDVCSGLQEVNVLLEQRSSTVSEAQRALKHAWDQLDSWHSHLTLLENHVQDLAEQQPDAAHLFLDQLTEPLQRYQKAARRAEHLTAFLGKIPVRLKQFEDLLCSATRWLDEAQSWLGAPGSFTTARSLQSHTHSLQLVLDDSQRIRDALQSFRPVLAEISAVCDISAQEERLEQTDRHVHTMQGHILEPLELLLQGAAVVEALETELKMMERNVPKIRTILFSMSSSDIALMEHLHNRQVILANVQAMGRTLEEMQRCRGELKLPKAAEDSLLVFSRAQRLLEDLKELEQITRQQASVLQETNEASPSEDEEDQSCCSSSSDTLTCSGPEDPEELLRTSDLPDEDVIKKGEDTRTRGEPGTFTCMLGISEGNIEENRDENMEEENIEENMVGNMEENRDENIEEENREENMVGNMEENRDENMEEENIEENMVGNMEENRDEKNSDENRDENMDDNGEENRQNIEENRDGNMEEENIENSQGPEETVRLQRTCQNLLQGIRSLLEVGEDAVAERQTSSAGSRGELEAVICRQKKLLKVLRSQMAFVQLLFQCEPETLRCQEEEREQLEVRANALQQTALQQEVTSQVKLQEWNRWEVDCSRLSRQLDELEAPVSGGDAGDELQQTEVQHRLQTCQQTLVQLDASRPALGLILDQTAALRAQPAFGSSVSLVGGALELRWRAAYRRAEEEVLRCRKLQDTWSRVALLLLADQLLDANRRLATWSHDSEVNQQGVHRKLITLLDFTRDVETLSAQRSSVSRAAARLLHLTEAECPGLRAHLAEMEVNWSRLTSDLSKIQDQLQQKLLLSWPPLELLWDLEECVKEQEEQLKQDRESESKEFVRRGLLLLDFLSQSGPQVLLVDVQALCSTPTIFAEQVGVLRLRWLEVQAQLESQVREAEQISHTCVDRQRRLQRLRTSVEQQKKNLRQCQQPTAQTLAHRALLEWAVQKQDVGTGEGVSPVLSSETSSFVFQVLPGEVKQVDAALQEVKSSHLFAETDRDHPLRCSLQHQQARVFSEQQMQEQLELLQQQELLKLNELFPSLVDVNEMRASLHLRKQDAETLDTLCGHWVNRVTHLSDVHSCRRTDKRPQRDLMSIMETLEQESESRKFQPFADVQRYSVSIRSLLVAQVLQVKDRWLRCVSSGRPAHNLYQSNARPQEDLPTGRQTSAKAAEGHRPPAAPCWSGCLHLAPQVCS